MNKEEYEKMNTFDKIDYDIQMELYMKYNDTIATINDHLGEEYGYSDLKNYEDLEKQEELSLYKKALKEKCNCLDKAIELLDKLNIQLKDVLKTEINIKEISDIKETLKDNSNE